jgi:hypothetical protein
MSAATHGAIRNITLVAHFILGRRTVLPADLRMSFLNSERDLEDRNNIYTPSILCRTNQNSGHRPGSLVTRTARREGLLIIRTDRSTGKANRATMR